MAVCLGIAAVLVALGALAGPAFGAPKPDLRTSELSGAPASVAAGEDLSIEDTVENASRSRAGRSTTRFYLSVDPARGGGDTRLAGKRRVGRLGKHKSSSGESELGIPLDTPQDDLYLLACADDRDQVAEKREHNNCLASDAAITLELPPDCTDRLTALGIDFDPGPAQPGVADPVTVETPISGITYSQYAGENVDQLYMDCTLALALHEMAFEMSSRGLVHVEQVGIYGYRCISDPGPPPNCPNGISQHAYGTAIDITELRSDSDTYNVEDDWVIDADATCSAATSNAKDALLHELACALHAGGVFNILLTPNYNAAHRNHFHFDLTPDASFID